MRGGAFPIFFFVSLFLQKKRKTLKIELFFCINYKGIK